MRELNSKVKYFHFVVVMKIIIRRQIAGTVEKKQLPDAQSDANAFWT